MLIFVLIFFLFLFIFYLFEICTWNGSRISYGGHRRKFNDVNGLIPYFRDVGLDDLELEPTRKGGTDLE